MKYYFKTSPPALLECEGTWKFMDLIATAVNYLFELMFLIVPEYNLIEREIQYGWS